jgi:hypothetical protein
MTSTPPNSTAAAQEWDQLRVTFASSLMVDTPLTSLAQNLDGLTWPFEGISETPAAYIDSSYDELCLELAARGQPKAPALLLQILRETLAFDQPFGDMVRQTAEAASRDNPILRTLAQLGIPENLPIQLTALDETARELCRLEGILTIGEFALLSQSLSQTVIIGGDLRRLLNALAHVDGGALAQLIPFRPGTRGVHLAEAIALAARGPKPEEQVAFAIDWFAVEFADWKQRAAIDRKFLPRQFASFDDLELEERISQLLVPHLRPEDGEPGAWSRFTRWFKR